MTVTLPHLEIWQKDVFNFYNENKKGKWLVTKSLRQSGKSVLAQILLLYSSLSTPDSVSISVSPVLLQSKKMYEDICRISRPLIAKSNSTIYEILFLNGSKILFKSAEQGDTIRGNTVKNGGIVIVDEAAYIKDELFYSVIVPTTNVYNSDIIIFSTPRYKQGFFYSLYTQGLTPNEKVKSFNWNEYNTEKYLPIETRQIYKLQMPRKSYLTEIEGEFIDGEGSVFSNFTHCLRDSDIDIFSPIVLAVDWAVGLGKDYTVISYLQLDGGIIKCIKQIEFNDKTANQTIDIIIAETEKLCKLNIPEITIINEKNGIGNVFNQVLLDRVDELQSNNRYNSDIQCTTFLTTNKSKDRMVKEFNNLVEKSKIILPNDSRLVQQLSAYECKLTSNNNITYNAPIGQNDDRVMSLLIGTDKLYNEIIND